MMSPDLDTNPHITYNKYLDRVLLHERFRRSDRLSSLLRYVVDEELAGRGERLKGYSIAIDVIGRSQDFEAQSDSIVRVEMGRLRKALADYYGFDGADDQIRIDIPVGSYRPQFVKRTIDDKSSARDNAKPNFGLYVRLLAATTVGAIAGVAICHWVIGR